MRKYIDYQEEIAPTEHVLNVARHLHTPTNGYSLGDFECKFSQTDQTVIVDLMSGSEFPDDFDYSSLVGKQVKVTNTHALHYIATDAKVLGD